MITIYVNEEGIPLGTYDSQGALFAAAIPGGAVRSLRFDPATNGVLRAIVESPDELAQLRVLDGRITYRGVELPLQEEHPLTRAAWERDDIVTRLWTDGAVIKGRDLIMLLRMIAERVALVPPPQPGKAPADGQ